MSLRIGSVPYLNARPLAAWLDDPANRGDASLVYAPPSRLAGMLEAGELDVANVSILEGFRAPRLQLIPNISISAFGAVRTVRLFCRVPVGDVRTVALDSSSITSAALLRIILAERYDLAPEYTEQPPDVAAMLAENDAALIIGEIRGYDIGSTGTVLDLGEEWRCLTGLPFVYAGWLCRDEAASPTMIELLGSARDWGVKRLESLGREWAIGHGLDPAVCIEYLTDVMDYSLSPRLLHGLDEFHRKCMAHGILPAESAIHRFRMDSH